MTLKKRRWFNRGGKVKIESASPRKDFLLLSSAMTKLAPDMAATATMQAGDKYVISFDASGHNLLLETELRRLRNKIGLNFDYYIDKDRKHDSDTRAVKLTRPEIQDRLFIRFSPKDDIEWARIRGMFGLPSQVTGEVSEEETMETIGDR